MKNLTNQFAVFTSKLNKNHIQVVLMLVALAMLVLGAGAPEIIGGIGK